MKCCQGRGENLLLSMRTSCFLIFTWIRLQAIWEFQSCQPSWAKDTLSEWDLKVKYGLFSLNVSNSNIFLYRHNLIIHQTLMMTYSRPTRKNHIYRVFNSPRKNSEITSDRPKLDSYTQQLIERGKISTVTCQKYLSNKAKTLGKSKS